MYTGAGEMAQHLKALITVSKDLNSVPRTHMRWFAVARNSSSRVSGIPLLPPQAYATHMYISIYTHPYVNSTYAHTLIYTLYTCKYYISVCINIYVCVCKDYIYIFGKHYQIACNSLFSFSFLTFPL